MRLKIFLFKKYDKTRDNNKDRFKKLTGKKNKSITTEYDVLGFSQTYLIIRRSDIVE